MATAIKWSDAEYDQVARAALKLPTTMKRADQLREAQKVLPKDRQKVIATNHLGGKSFVGLKAALARVDATKRVDQQRSAALKARSAMGELRRSLAGQGPRMAEAMKKASKSDADVANATGVHLHSIRTVLRDKTKTMMDKNIAKVATYLGCNYGWLRAGVDADMPLEFTIDAVADNKPDHSGAEAVLVPHVGKRGNGAVHPRSHEGRIEATMRSNLDSTMGSLWGLMPTDVQVMIISRMAELLAKGRQQ